jgi:aspartate racemase
MSAIGIIGGMGPQASAQLVELLVCKSPEHFEIHDDSDFPEIVLVSVPVPNFVESKENMKQAARIVSDRAKLLEIAHCDVAGIACNTAHLFLPEVQQATSVPFLSMPRLVGAHVTTHGWRRVGLLATPNTLSSQLYDDALPSGVELVRPSHEVATRVEAFIMRQLAGKPGLHDREQLQKLIEQFRIDRQLDAIILGCTELPLVFGETDDPTVIDTLAILADGLLAHHAKKEVDV